MILSVPDTADRYYVMPFMDQWTNVFDSIGSRNTGTGAGDFLITGPNWQGKNSDNLHQINAPNNRIWLIGRIQTNTVKDYENVRSLQQEFKLTSYSNWKKSQFNPAYFANYDLEDENLEGFSIDPNDAVKTLSAVNFFERFQKLSIGKIPENEIEEVSEMLITVGISTQHKSYIKPGFFRNFLVQQGVEAAKKKMNQFISSKRSNENGWSVIRKNIGRYGKAYPTRAIVALLGLGALPPEEAAYPTTNQDSNGDTLVGTNRYHLHFAAGELPPVEAFWSLTLYDENGFFVGNPIKRYAIGDRDNLTYNDDGSLDLYIQHNQPENINNWLPAPADNFALTLRLYQPKTKFLDGSWKVPSVIRK